MKARRVAFSGHGYLTGIVLILILMGSWVKVSCRVRAFALSC